MNVKYVLARIFERGWAARARAGIGRDPIEGWIDIDAQAAAIFTVSLGEQLPPGHRLGSQRWRAVARVDGGDDILFASRSGQYAAVHLTWQRETDPRWPNCAIFPSQEAMRNAYAQSEADGEARFRSGEGPLRENAGARDIN